MELVDQLQRKLSIARTPTRIISLVPSQTELLVDLGLEDYIVGVTKFCVHPVHIKQSKTIVGGTKNIKIDKIKALQPDIILCNKEENTQDIVMQCAAICTVHVSDIFTIADCIEMIQQYGELFDKKNEADTIAGLIQQKLGNFQSYIKEKPHLKVAYFIWRNPWMVAGHTTFINHLLAINHFENIFKDQARYPEVAIEALPKDIDLILLSSEPYPFKEKHIQEISKYAKQAKVILVDGELFSWYGSRMIQSFSYFKQLREGL